MSLWNLDSRYICSPGELYEDLKKMGYNWDELLETRGFWIFNDNIHPRKYLSTMDLLKMRVGEYKPYWMNIAAKSKKTKAKDKAIA